MKKENILSLLVFLGIFSLYLLLPVDTDLGWHLRYGKEIFEKGHFFKTNEIGFFLPDYQWQHSYSGYQLLTFAVFKIFGLGGLIFANAILMTGIFFFLFLALKKNLAFFLAVFSFVFFAGKGVTDLGWRSQLFTLLGISFFFFFLQKPFSFKKLFLLPLLFFLWANFHGGFVLGLILLCFSAADKLIRQQKKQLLPLLVIILLSFLAALINPFGLGVYKEAIRHSWYPLDKLIAEWVPPAPTGLFFLFLGIAFAFLAFISDLRKIRQKNSLLFLLSFLFFAFLAFKARRNLPLFALGTAYLFGFFFPRELKPIPKKLKSAIILLFFLAALTFSLNRLPHFPVTWEEICRSKKGVFPCQATEFLKENSDLCPKIFNTYEWGGYLAWHLPKSKTFVDGRTPAWKTPERKSPYTIYLELLQTRPGYQEAFDYYQPDCLFIASGTFLDLELKKGENKNWKEIYRDKIAVIYQKN